ncbi:hypothetical protein D3C85_1494630 [compost metagenome]
MPLRCCFSCSDSAVQHYHILTHRYRTLGPGHNSQDIHPWDHVIGQPPGLPGNHRGCAQ